MYACVQETGCGFFGGACAAGHHLRFLATHPTLAFANGSMPKSPYSGFQQLSQRVQ
jgi:hypothetical protein